MFQGDAMKVKWKRLLSLFMCLQLPICIAAVLNLTETICPKIWAKTQPKNAKSRFLIDGIAQKRLCLNSQNLVTINFINFILKRYSVKTN